jgi:wyosine [tRNA(Phe)-imidazoG37] synthetase (radical SAM superfamily)
VSRVIADPAREGRRAPLRVDRHPRELDDNRYVYAVLSRRARGVSIGVNLCPDKSCQFRCVYCQVDRTAPPRVRRVDEGRLARELAALLADTRSGRLLERVCTNRVPPAWRRVADVALSGDGEPTAHPRFLEIVRRVAATIDREHAGLPITLITNAALLHAPRVREAVAEIARRGGRVWAKLDAGSEEHYERVARTRVPFARILENISEESRRHPITIQSLFFREGGSPPPEGEIAAYVERLVEIVRRGGALAEVQITTVARRPPSPAITALPAPVLEAIARSIRDALPQVPVNVYPARPAELEREGPAGDEGEPR